jgi:hypothetical protein
MVDIPVLNNYVESSHHCSLGAYYTAFGNQTQEMNIAPST